MVFLRVGWMDWYQGIRGRDSIARGGAYVAEHGYGHEIFNFQEQNGLVYGYVQAPRAAHNRSGEGRLHVVRLGAAPEDESVSGVLAIWVATAPQGGAYIVGWYRNATLFRDWQQPPLGEARRHQGQDFGYYATASFDDAVLVPTDERVFAVPQKGKGAMGQSNVWYADDPEIHREFRSRVRRYIETREAPESARRASARNPRQADPLLRQRIEMAAVELVTTYYTQHGYQVDSFEKDNLGWDLEAVLGDRKLRLEVKGLSRSEVVVDLTPREFEMLQTYRDSYRLCVVSRAITEPSLEIFRYSPEASGWVTDEGRVLIIEELVAARCRTRRPER